MTTGERIKKLRLEKGLSQEELGKRIGVQRAAINKYEKGLVVNLKRETIAKLAVALDTTPTELMGFDEETKEPTVIDDGLSEKRHILIEFAKSVPEDKVELVLRIMKSIVEDD